VQITGVEISLDARHPSTDPAVLAPAAQQPSGRDTSNLHRRMAPGSAGRTVQAISAGRLKANSGIYQLHQLTQLHG